MRCSTVQVYSFNDESGAFETRTWQRNVEQISSLLLSNVLVLRKQL